MGTEKLEGSKHTPRHPELVSESYRQTPVNRFRIKCGMTIRLLICFVILLLGLGQKTFAQSYSQILQSDSSKIVKVAISDNGFKSFVYKKINIVANSDFTLYEKETKKQIAKFNPQDILEVTYDANGFDFKVNNKTVAKNQKGVYILDCPGGHLGVQNLKRSGRYALYHGIFELTPKNEETFFLVNTVDLENYLKGVVPNEMPVRFGLEALKAQAIAARNYVLMPRTRTYKEFDVDDSVASQVYFGANSETDLSNRAVKETEGLVALYNWDLILALYCSTAGGYTENYENAFSEPKTKIFPANPKPYLQGKPDICSVCPLTREEEAKFFYMSYPESYDIKSPYYRWQKQWDAKELQEVLQKTLVAQSKTTFVWQEFKKGDTLGELKSINVKSRGVSGKAIELEIVTDKATYHVYKELVIRRVMQKDGISLPSANVVFENLYDTKGKLTKVIAYGGGFGHGVGMSQFGAGYMATTLNKKFDEILKRYYTGISISTAPVILSSEDNQKTVTQTFFAPCKRGIVVVDNKYNIGEFSAKINNMQVAFELSKNIVPFNRFTKIDISSYINPGRNTITFYFPEDAKNKGIRLYIELVEQQ